MITIDPDSPEVEWPPFVRWAESQSLDLTDVCLLTLTGEGAADLEVFVRDSEGELVVQGDQVVTRVEKVSLSAPPPLNR